MKKILSIALILALPAASAQAFNVFLSPDGQAEVGTNITSPVNDDSGTGSTNIWIQKAENNEKINGIGLNIVSTTPGVISFTGATIYNPSHDLPFVGPTPRWQGASVGPVTPNSITGMNAANVTTGTGLDPTLDGTGGNPLDPFFDVDSGNFLYATVDYTVIGGQGDSTNLFLQIGDIGASTNARSSSQIDIVFGADGDPGLNGESDRNTNSATPDGSVSVGDVGDPPCDFAGDFLDNLILPDNDTQGPPWDFRTVDVSNQDCIVDERTRGLWFDPPPTTGYIYETDGASNFVSVELPPGSTVDDGDDMYLISSVEGDVVVGEGGMHTFDSPLPLFTVTGINPALNGDDPLAFPTKLLFDQNTVTFSMTPIPEPSTILLAAMGLVGLVAYRWRAGQVR